MAFRVGVLASGSGTNLQALLDGVHGRDGVEVAAVASNRADARALERARSARVPTAVFPASDHAGRAARDAAIAAWLGEREVDLVVLAGYMELLHGTFLRPFAGRVINVHPSLLPAFPGLRAVRQALDYGVKVVGVTVHFVDDGVDTGPVILQRALDVTGAETEDQVLDRLHPVEHELLPQAVRLLAAGRVTVAPGARRVDIAPG